MSGMGAPGLGAGGMGSLSIELEFPQSLGVYDKYADAQRAVDYLADNSFPVQNIVICGTELKLLERVTGRRSWGQVIGRGVLNGVMTGLLLGFLFSLFTQPGMGWVVFAVAIGLGIFFSVVTQAIGYAMTGGRRDFNSITQTIPTKFEILCEHKVAMKAREMLAEMPENRAKLFE